MYSAMDMHDSVEMTGVELDLCSSTLLIIDCGRTFGVMTVSNTVDIVKY